MAALPHILVIEDSEDDRDLYERFLRDETSLITMAEAGEEGIARYRQAPADGVLLDFNLPGHDGLSILDRLRAIDPYVAVVMMTGEGSQDIAVAAMKAGASDYVVKDTITAATLKRALTNAIDKARLLRQLAEQQREQVNFIRVLVHDIRAPLRGLTAFTDILAEDLEAGIHDDLLDHLGMIKTSALRLNALIDTLAHYALLDKEPIFDEVDMNGVVDQAVANLKTEIEGSRADVTYGALPAVTGHEPQLVQLLQNLIGNGIKYCEAATPMVRIEAEADGEGNWLLSVTDNGIGIPEAKQQTVFEPFQRLWSQDVYEGTGLGLAICRKIVERHDGRIWCESEEGSGSRFFLTLPAASLLESAADLPPRSKQAVHG